MPDTRARLSTLSVQGTRPSLEPDTDVRSLIPKGIQIRQPIRYGDDRWVIEGYPLTNQNVTELDFRLVPIRWRTIIKDWVLLRLNPSLARSGLSRLDTQAPLALATAASLPISMMSAVAYLYTFTVTLPIVDARGTKLGPLDWKAVAQSLRDRDSRVSSKTNATYARPLNALWTVRGLLRVPDMFGGRPFGGEAVEKVFAVPARDLNVDRPEPQLCGPLLGLCLWIIDNCAEDILARVEHLAVVPDRSHAPRQDQIAAVIDLLDEWNATGRALPATVGLRGDTTGLRPSWATFVKLAGASNQSLKNPVGDAVAVWKDLCDRRGVSRHEDGFNLPIRQVTALDGSERQWTDALVATRYGFGLDHWVSTLAYACAYVIALLTTVRDRELAALPDDCLREGTYEAGDIDVPVTRMRGYLVKNVGEPIPASWVVGEDVMRAVGIIQRLKKALHLEPRLHPVTQREILLHPGLGLGANSGKDTLVLEREWLRRFESTGNFLGERGLIAAFPELPTWLSHRTIRITGIEAYASQPWGDALASAQAHWSSRTVAEGYYGHLPNSVYIADPDAIEEVRQVLVGQTLLDVAADANATAAGLSDVVGGAGTGRLDAVLEQAEAYELVNSPVTGKQLVKIAANNPNVTVGTFTICIFGPGGLCGSVHEANFRLCRPGKCRNSAMTRGQRAREELVRRGHAGKGGIFERAKRKIEADMPALQPEFAVLDDSDLIEIVLTDLPGRYAAAARNAVPA
ncbi:hypothetical protein [Curtobacterium sp. MCBD17_021]|uniref:hypothetical protein n=1 Tax=Curtobacterium sp. MCBD17_021 TaxID=2175665 RepID=UPI000DAAAEBD|nr:hypothetical protein [Curtobacterium sp. MCBD17_021]PZE68769.1 hypothetical protein DEI83_02225 [Curtobacterium sp. MCBD17_021]